MFELHNAGATRPIYHEHRLRYAREFLALFPDEDADHYLEFRRAEGEALWFLDRVAEAEAVFQALIRKLPDKAWGYIGWSDQYYFWSKRPQDYQRAEAILLQALDQPGLDDRESVLDRLKTLYRQWQKSEQEAAVVAELATLRSATGPPLSQPAAVKIAPSSIRKRKGQQPKRKKQRRRR